MFVGGTGGKQQNSRGHYSTAINLPTQQAEYLIKIS